jgi:hypothetical protein
VLVAQLRFHEQLVVKLELLQLVQVVQPVLVLQLVQVVQPVPVLLVQALLFVVVP